jgi:high-affinity nickel permease
MPPAPEAALSRGLRFARLARAMHRPQPSIVVLPMNPATPISALLGLALVALVLGMRHGIDADHLAAIDAMTRCNAQARPALARRTGLWFSTGHGAVVLAVAFGVALTAHAWAAPGWLEPFGAWASIAMLVLLGVLNLAAWRRSGADNQFIARVF